MYYSSWDKLNIYKKVEWDNLYVCRRLDDFGPRTTMTGSCFKETFQHRAGRQGTPLC